jgi:hypothetical protein
MENPQVQVPLLDPLTLALSRRERGFRPILCPTLKFVSNSIGEGHSEGKKLRESTKRPISITIAALLIALYAAMFIALDLITPFERPYAEGPVSVVLGMRVFGIWAQLMHALQLLVALALVYGLWTMQRWGWQLTVFVAGYMLLSSTIWVAVYQEISRITFAFFYLIIVNLLLALTFPHREKFVSR